MSPADEVHAAGDSKVNRTALAANMDLRKRDKLPKGSPKRHVALPPPKAQTN
jgi:hypothetical protein